MLLLMRFLGIDYGMKRVGIALSDADGAMAFPYATYTNDETLVARIGALCTEKDVGGVVIGKSHDLDGTPNRVQKDIDAFVGDLRAELSVSIDFEAEQFSTQAALRIQGRNEQTDASAAALILDTYLARQTPLPSHHHVYE